MWQCPRCPQKWVDKINVFGIGIDKHFGNVSHLSRFTLFFSIFVWWLCVITTIRLSVICHYFTPLYTSMKAWLKYHERSKTLPSHHWLYLISTGHYLNQCALCVNWNHGNYFIKNIFTYQNTNENTPTILNKPNRGCWIPWRFQISPPDQLLFGCVK